MDWRKSLKLTKLKLINTPHNLSQNHNFGILIQNYLKNLPNEHLKEFSFSLPNKNIPINYLNLLSTLNLNKLRIFMRGDPEYNTLDQVIPLIHLASPNLSIELIFYKFNGEPILDTSEFDRIAVYQNVKISELESPYKAFPKHNRREVSVKSLAAYKRAIHDNKFHEKNGYEPYARTLKHTNHLIDNDDFDDISDLVDIVLNGLPN